MNAKALENFENSVYKRVLEVQEFNDKVLNFTMDSNSPIEFLDKLYELSETTNSNLKRELALYIDSFVRAFVDIRQDETIIHDSHIEYKIGSFQIGVPLTKNSHLLIKRKSMLEYPIEPKIIGNLGSNKDFFKKYSEKNTKHKERVEFLKKVEPEMNILSKIFLLSRAYVNTKVGNYLLKYIQDKSKVNNYMSDVDIFHIDYNNQIEFLERIDELIKMYEEIGVSVKKLNIR